MTRDWVWLLTLCTLLLVVAQALPTNLAEDAKKLTEQTMRPKSKRAQEMLMFGNQQQNRQAESKPSASRTSTAEKRTVAASGLGGLKAALVEEEKSSRSNAPNSGLYDRDSFSPYDKNYDYGKVLVNELGEELPQTWNVPSYPRYYFNEDRRKRFVEKSTIAGSTTMKPVTTSHQAPTSTQQSVQSQAKRSVPIYQEPRFKRELDIDPEDVLTLLSLWENERRKRNWHKYVNEEYDNVDDEDNLLAEEEEEEDARNAIPWMSSSVYPPRHYSVDSLSPSDIGIVRTHPSGYYEQYENQYGQQYDTSRYENPQYGLIYPQQAYYNVPEKRFMISRKRAQVYDPYSSATQFQINPQSRYPYQRRLVY